MFDMAQSVKVVCAYIIIVMFICAAITLLGVIIHLLHVVKLKNENRKANFQVLFMIIITLIGIISFFISILFIILLLFQIILLDGHKLDPNKSSLNEFYYESFEELEYLIVVFDAFGHLSMLCVFIVRLRMCFANSIFGYSKRLIHFMYCCLIVLFAMSFVIIMEIVNKQDPKVIIITEIIWELLIEVMCIWLLYLFVSKLHALVKMALGTSRKDLRLTISYNISEKTHNSNNENIIINNNKKEGSRNNSLRRLSRFSRTSLDVDREKSTSKSRSPSPLPKSPSSQAPNKRVKPNQTVLNNQNLINVMTKMTLLVVIAVFGSILSVIGNIYIEIHEIENIEHHTANIESMWAFLLPVTDMILASFMLYLQFDFTKHVYAKLCTRMDIIFLQFCGDILDKEVTHEQMKVHREQSANETDKYETDKSKSDKSARLELPNMDKENSMRRHQSMYSNGAEIPDMDRAITPRPKDLFGRDKPNRLTVEISADPNENTGLRSPSPSPSPFNQIDSVINEAIKRNDSIQIQIKPPRLSTVSQFEQENNINTNKYYDDMDLDEEEHDEEEKLEILKNNHDEEGDVATKLKIHQNGNNQRVMRNKIKLNKLRVNIKSTTFDEGDDDGVITPISPTPLSDPPVTPSNDDNNNRNNRRYWE